MQGKNILSTCDLAKLLDAIKAATFVNWRKHFFFLSFIFYFFSFLSQPFNFMKMNCCSCCCNHWIRVIERDPGDERIEKHCLLLFPLVTFSALNGNINQQRRESVFVEIAERNSSTSCWWWPSKYFVDTESISCSLQIVHLNQRGHLFKSLKKPSGETYHRVRPTRRLPAISDRWVLLKYWGTSRKIPRFPTLWDIQGGPQRIRDTFPTWDML